MQQKSPQAAIANRLLKGFMCFCNQNQQQVADVSLWLECRTCDQEVVDLNSGAKSGTAGRAAEISEI